MRTGAIVLAGGASRRMGRPKALLEVAGRPLLLRIVEHVARVCDVVVVAARPGQLLPALPPGVERADDPDELAGAGPLAGIAAGLAALEPRVDVAYCSSTDAALLSAVHVRFMIDRLLREPELEAVVPVSDDAGRRFVHPLAGAVRVGAAAEACHRLLARGERRAAALYEALRSLPVAAADLPDPRALATCNTPAEWAALTRELDPTPRR